MDFLSIRKKAREGAAEAESRPSGGAGATTAGIGDADRGTAPPPALPPPPPVPDEAPQPRFEERRRGRGGERVLTDKDLAEGALQARLQGLEPSQDGRFATWRPGAGPPPVEPDAQVFDAPAASPAGEGAEDGAS